MVHPTASHLPSFDTHPGQHVEAASLLLIGYRKAMAHKWIQSKHAGRDLGSQALQEWVDVHWPRFLRACWVEHVEGRRRWHELDPDAFNALSAMTEACSDNKGFDLEIVHDVMQMLRDGMENLDVVNWALKHGHALHDVTPVLECLNINCSKIDPDWHEG